MRRQIKVTPPAAGLETAIGLVWGLIELRQNEKALTLIEGCLSCWPAQETLLLLQQLCTTASGKPLQKIGIENALPQWAPLMKILKNRNQLNTAQTQESPTESSST
jgi:hypothetical protein